MDVDIVNSPSSGEEEVSNNAMRPSPSSNNNNNSDSHIDCIRYDENDVPKFNHNLTDKDSADRENIFKRFGKFLFHSGIPSFCLRILGLCIFFGVFGALLFLPTSSSFPKILETVFRGCLALSISLFFWLTVLVTIHLFVLFCQQRRFFYNWKFIHYLSELEKFAAAIVSISFILILLSFNVIIEFSDKHVFGAAVNRYFYIKIMLGILLTVVLLAIKRHFMTGLAVSFNYSNYKDRIQESIFADKMLGMLQKAKHTYKFRLKWNAGVNERGKRAKSLKGGGKRQKDDILKTGNLNRTSLPGGIGKNQSVRSAMDLFPENLSSKPPLNVPKISSTFATPSSPLQSPTIISGKAPVRSIAAYLTETEKQKQFSEFFRLANQMMARFSNVTDYRQEIQHEAQRVSVKLYKYLLPFDREYLMGQDLLPFIEDQGEFIKAVILIRKYSEGSSINLSMSYDECCMFAFHSQDLLRAIDGILTELYVTAKSLQTIETALDKVDFFFSLLVGLFMVIVVAIVVGDAVKLLLALSTLLSGAAFAFGTSARNMFESMIFLLVIHPFDVGDRVFVPLGTTMPAVATTVATMAGTDSLDNLIVAEMHLLSTVFERWDGVRLYVPNYVLAGKPIYNIRRSGALCELQRIHIDFTTPIAKIEELRRRVDEYVRREQSDFTDISRIFIDSMENCNRININFIYQHSTNWQDMDTQLSRRSKMLSFMKDTLEQLEITYLPPVQRVAIVPTDRMKGTSSTTPLITSAEVNRLLQFGQQHHNLPV